MLRSFGTPWENPAAGNAALYVIRYIEFRTGATLNSAREALLHYAQSTNHDNAEANLNVTVLAELNRPARYAALEIWTDAQHYQDWLGSATSRDFSSSLRPLLAAPVDQRLTRLCASTFVDSQGCVSP